MDCVLLDHLNRQLIHAKVCTTPHEVKRIEGEITKHKEKCAVCAGIEQNQLINNFFNGLKVVVLK